MNSKLVTFKNAYLFAFKHTIPVLTGFMTLGIAYGVLMASKGYGVVWAVLTSMVVFGGSIQYVAITLLTTAFDPISALLLSLIVNARHLFYGISLLKKYKGVGKIKFFLIYLLCDETFSLVSSIDAPKEIESRYFYLAISTLDYFYWVLATAIGATIGMFITINTKGLDFALTALFVVLFIEQLRSSRNYVAGMIGIGGTVISLCIFGSSNLVIPSMIIVMASFLIMRLITKNKKEAAE